VFSAGDIDLDHYGGHPPSVRWRPTHLHRHKLRDDWSHRYASDLHSRRPLRPRSSTSDPAAGAL